MYDFIVVGSGASGGTLIKHLHKSGAKVLLLEAGKAFTKKTFPKNEMDFSAQLYWGGGLEFDTQAKTAFLRAKVLGGTTIVNQALVDRFDEDCFNDWKNRTGIDFMNVSEMTPYYERVEASMKMHTFKEASMNKNAHLFRNACEKLGYDWKYLRRGQSDCMHDQGNDCIGCLGGCFRDSKQSSLVTHIQQAIKEGLEIKTEFEVTRIEHKPDHVLVYGTHNGKKVTLKTAKVCLAGGSFGTTGMLLNSGFKKQLPSLGKGFTQHPQFMYFGVFDDPINAHKGAFQTVASGYKGFRNKGFKLEVVYAQPISVAMLLSSYGAQHQKAMMNFTKMSSIEVAVRDEPEGGEINIDKKGKLIVSKKLTDQDIKRRNEGIDVLKNIIHAQGAKDVLESPVYFGLHLMGGCRIGVNGANSVVNPNFQVHDHKNIYIADTSIFPSAPGINPSLSAMAFSEKLAETLL